MELPFTNNFCYKRLEGDKPLTGCAATNLPMEGMLLAVVHSKCVHSHQNKKQKDKLLASAVLWL